MKNKIVVVHPGSSAEYRVDVSAATPVPHTEETRAEDPRVLHIPDLWHVGQWLKKNDAELYGDMVLEAWALLHACVKHIQTKE